MKKLNKKLITDRNYPFLTSDVIDKINEIIDHINNEKSGKLKTKLELTRDYINVNYSNMEKEEIIEKYEELIEELLK